MWIFLIIHLIFGTRNSILGIYCPILPIRRQYDSMKAIIADNGWGGGLYWEHNSHFIFELWIFLMIHIIFGTKKSLLGIGCPINPIRSTIWFRSNIWCAILVIYSRDPIFSIRVFWIILRQWWHAFQSCSYNPLIF